MDEFTNRLIDETSPYLLQHAHNPVDWYPWNEETLALAKKENKLILISIGYAACHWCHVMEKESFEDLEVAKIMNTHFINIKVDREERPDVDQVYMDAVQLITGRGGWPLNCIALPDGRPIWGGTYFQKDQWVASLLQLSTLYKNEPEKIHTYASELTKGILQSDLIVTNNKPQEFTAERVITTVKTWQDFMDYSLGGTKRAPKFPMPNTIEFLLQYAVQFEDQQMLNYVNTTLTNMAYGGIFDQIGGGFSRYSVDAQWHIPHFEKMLYDNAQLIQLYAQAYKVTKNPLYKATVEQTIEFLERDLMDQHGAFYSSLDADSKNEDGVLEEGAYYSWTKERLKDILGTSFELFAAYYSISEEFTWEHTKYQLFRSTTDTEFARQHKLSIEDLLERIKDWKSRLLKERNLRNHPRLDDKILTSWNALMLSAYTEAYRAFGNPNYKKRAEKLGHFIKGQVREEGALWRNYKNEQSSINGYLEDYATVIEAFISLYQISIDPTWLNTAKELTSYCFENFYDNESGFFYFTSSKDPALISRKIDIEDNVISGSNSIMAKNLIKLGTYFGDLHYQKVAKTMLHHVQPKMIDYGAGYSNWAQLYTTLLGDYYEIAIVGPEAIEKLKEMQQHYIPNGIWMASKKDSNLPLLANKYEAGITRIFVCLDGSCQLPVTSSEKALNQIDIKLK